MVLRGQNDVSGRLRRRVGNIVDDLVTVTILQSPRGPQKGADYFATRLRADWLGDMTDDESTRGGFDQSYLLSVEVRTTYDPTMIGPGRWCGLHEAASGEFHGIAWTNDRQALGVFAPPTTSRSGHRDLIRAVRALAAADVPARDCFDWLVDRYRPDVTFEGDLAELYHDLNA